MHLLNALVGFSKRRSRRNLYPWLHEAIASYHVGTLGRVLNIGAGGDVADELARAGIHATAVDIDPERKPDILASVENLEPFGDATVDAIFCLEVLEHVGNPHAAAEAIHRVLRPGGLVIGSTPFLLGVHDQPRDYYRYTSHGLSLVFSRFEQLVLRGRNGYFAAVAVLITRRFAAGTPRDRRLAGLLSPILLMLALALEALEKILPARDGTTGYFFVFRKPGAPGTANS
jgi:SAM-dependent methyltransferase